MFRACHAFLSVNCNLVVTCWERAYLLALLCVMFIVLLSLSRAVSLVRCGTLLYRFLIFASLHTVKVLIKGICPYAISTKISYTCPFFLFVLKRGHFCDTNNFLFDVVDVVVYIIVLRGNRQL